MSGGCPTNPAWSHWLRTRRRAWFPSLKDMALEVEITPQRLEAIEDGNRPDHGEAVRIARAFGVAGGRFLALLDQPAAQFPRQSSPFHGEGDRAAVEGPAPRATPRIITPPARQIDGHGVFTPEGIITL